MGKKTILNLSQRGLGWGGEGKGSDEWTRSDKYYLKKKLVDPHGNVADREAGEKTEPDSQECGIHRAGDKRGERSQA